MLFIACITQGVFPDVYKASQGIPLFKGGGVNCYRPISLLPALEKLFEKLISTRIVEYIKKFEIVSPNQFGCGKYFGTEYVTLHIHEELLSNLHKGLDTCSIFLDLAKAIQ